MLKTCIITTYFISYRTFTRKGMGTFVDTNRKQLIDSRKELSILWYLLKFSFRKTLKIFAPIPLLHFCRNIIFFLFSSLPFYIPSMASAQQLIQQGLYMLDPYNINPAYGGLNNSITVTGDFRKQWTEINGRPQSQYITLHAPLHSLNSGIGAQFTHDQLGASKITSGMVSYNYYLPTPILISIGGSIGLTSKKLESDILLTPDGKYEIDINHNDPNIPNISTTSNNGIINLGIFTRINAWEIGLSGYQTTKLGKRNTENYYYQPYRHIILYSGYTYNIDEDWKIAPSLLIKTDIITLQSELDIHVYNNNIFGGIGVRGYNKNSIDAVKLVLGGRLSEHLLLAYNFESSIGNIKTFSGNTHELLLQYRIKTNIIKRPKEKIIYHPRM